MGLPSRRSLVSLAVVFALALAACSSSDDEPSAAPDPTPAVTEAPTPPPVATAAPTPPPVAVDLTTYEQFRAGPTACGADRPARVTPMTFDGPEDEGLDPNTPISVIIETSCGNLEVELDPGLAPLAVNSFVFLARKGFFDGTVSHRIIPGFMFQAGDQTASGGGGPGYRLPVDEWPAQGFAYVRGVVAMANAGPVTTGSQFFIMMGPSSLPPNFTVIGRLVSGDEVLDAIGAIPITARPGGEVSLPLETFYIEHVRVDADA